MKQEPLQRLYQETLENGLYKPNRTAVDTVYRFGPQIRIDLTEGFPLPTVKDTWFHGVKHELLWFLRGDTNIKYLVDNNVHIWDDNAYHHYLRKQGVPEEEIDPHSRAFKEGKEAYIERIENDPAFAEEHGDLGPVYGKQWREWERRDGGTIDQIGNIMDEIKYGNKYSRRLVETAWNPEDVEDMALPPCHVLYQFDVNPRDELSCKMTQRSADLGIGSPFNIPSTAAKVHLLADQTGLDVNEVIYSLGNAHLYCGSGERGRWYKENLPELQERVVDAEAYEDFQQIREWVVDEAPPEPPGAENKDHIPAALEMLSREPRDRPRLQVENQSALEAYTGSDLQVTDYNPHEKITMAMAV